MRGLIPNMVPLGLGSKFWTSTRFFELCLTIPEDDIASQISDSDVPEAYAKRPEDWFPDRLLEYFGISKDFDYETGPTGKRRFVKNERNERELWNCFTFLLRTLDQRGKALDVIRKKPSRYTTENEDDMQKFCHALSVLEALVNFSPAFWRLCGNNALTEAIGASMLKVSLLFRPKRDVAKLKPG
jgi:hypothetical protein